MRILIAEDERAVALATSATLKLAGHNVVVTRDGEQALTELKRQHYDALVTDWMMPKKDGIELIREIRAELEEPPIVLMVTALDLPKAKAHCLDAGADEYIAKPYDPSLLTTTLENCRQRRHQTSPAQAMPLVQPLSRQARFPAVAVAASTGGPVALEQFANDLDALSRAAYFLVLHGPGWMLESMAERVNAKGRIKVHVGESGMEIKAGNLYIAPGDHHMEVAGPPHRIRINQNEPENYVRPAADPLFRSVAQTFGKDAMAVVLTGMGCDGSRGAMEISRVGGRVIVQAPETAVAPSMPKSVLASCQVDLSAPLEDLAGYVNRFVTQTDLRIRAKS